MSSKSHASDFLQALSQLEATALANEVTESDESLIRLSQIAVAIATDESIKGWQVDSAALPGQFSSIAEPLWLAAQGGRSGLAAFRKTVGTERLMQAADLLGFKRKYTKAFEKELTQQLGQVYRMFIRTGRKFYVGGQLVPLKDPLWLDDGKNEPYSDETYEIDFGPEGEKQTESVRIRLVMLPDHGSTQLNKKHGYNIQKSGFYVLRNNREIAAAQLLGLNSLSRHPDFIRFRGEIFISGRMTKRWALNSPNAMSNQRRASATN